MGALIQSHCRLFMFPLGWRTAHPLEGVPTECEEEDFELAFSRCDPSTGLRKGIYFKRENATCVGDSVPGLNSPDRSFNVPCGEWMSLGWKKKAAVRREVVGESDFPLNGGTHD